MMESERLVQRFLDQELSADERVQFVVRLGRDDALRRRAIELEQLAIDASRLPRPIVPEGFTARVLDQIQPPVSPLPPSPFPLFGFWRRQWLPGAMQWNLVSAAAACLALLLAGGLISRVILPPAPEPGDTAVTSAGPSTVLVRLVVVQPGATTVQAAGDFNGWDPASTPLEQVSTGAWAVTLPLEPGRYQYKFVVDGRTWIVDPFAAEHNDDGFGSRNAVLEVRPPAGAPL